MFIQTLRLKKKKKEMGGMGAARPRDPRWGRMCAAGFRACGRGCAGVKPQQVPGEGGTGSRARRGGGAAPPQLLAPSAEVGAYAPLARRRGGTRRKTRGKSERGWEGGGTRRIPPRRGVRAARGGGEVSKVGGEGVRAAPQPGEGAPRPRTAAPHPPHPPGTAAAAVGEGRPGTWGRRGEKCNSPGGAGKVSGGAGLTRRTRPCRCPARRGRGAGGRRRGAARGCLRPVPPSRPSGTPSPGGAAACSAAR